MGKLKPWHIAVGIIFLIIAGIYSLLLWASPYLRLRTSAFFGDTRAMRDLGSFTRDTTWFERAGEHGDPMAYFSLGNLNSRHPEKAFAYYRKGAEIEIKKRVKPTCLGEVAKAYRYGLYGIEKNEAEAKRLFAIAKGIDEEIRKKEGW